MTEMLHQVVERYVESGEFTGSVLVRRGEETLLAEARGFAHRGFAVPNTVDTRFDIASVTKIFTAVAVMQLVERGAIALDTPVMPYLGITGTKISDAVTVFHCLTHTSGIADDADEEAGEEYELLFVDKPNYSIRETRDFLPQFVDKEPNFPPGEGVRYNNVAYVLLGLVIEQASGIPYRDYVRQHVFERARMTGADFCAMDGIHAHLAEHYKKIEHDDGRVEWRKNIYSYPPIGSPDGGATVAVADLDRFLRALANGRTPEPGIQRSRDAPARQVPGFGRRHRMDFVWVRSRYRPRWQRSPRLQGRLECRGQQHGRLVSADRDDDRDPREPELQCLAHTGRPGISHCGPVIRWWGTGSD